MRFIGPLTLLIICAVPVSAQQHFNIASADDVIGSVARQVVEKIYHRLGLDVEFVILPSGRALEQANAGVLDGDGCCIITIANRYPNLVPVPTPINFFEARVFVRDRTLAVETWEDLRGLNIGIQIGAKFAENITQDWPNIIAAPNNQKLFELLHAGRLDAVIASHADGQAQILNLGYTKVHVTERPVKILQLYHYLHTSHADLIPKIDAELQRMHASGELERIRRAAIESSLNTTIFWP